MTTQWITVDTVDVRYDIQRSSKAKARIIILPGLTEFIEKHQDQIDGFKDMGGKGRMETICIDWPGQGLSSRMANDHPTVIHIPSFDFHLKAIKAVVDDAGFGDDKPLFIFGHSMGAHLGLRLAHELKAERGWDIRGVMISSPMIMIPVVLRGITLMLLNGICRLGFAKTGIPGQQGFSRPRAQFNPMNVLTRDADGYMVQHRLFEKNPKLRTRGPSFGWVRSALASCMATTTNSAWLKAYDIPVQAHLAENEMVVHRFASEPALKQIKGVDIHIYDNARHELMLELPEVRAAIWQRMADFINNRMKT